MSKKKIVEVYQSRSKSQDWRWRIRAPNGNIIGASSEGFTTSAGAKRNLKTLTAALAVAEVEIMRSKVLKKAKGIVKSATKVKNTAEAKARAVVKAATKAKDKAERDVAKAATKAKDNAEAKAKDVAKAATKAVTKAKDKVKGKAKSAKSKLKKALGI